MRLIAAAIAMLAATAAAAQDAPGGRPKLLILGSSHFANPGQDFVNPSMPDMSAPERQAEIEDVVRRLATLSPTHVAVEWPAAAQATLDESYAAYRTGERPLDTRESEQIGFRLAAAAGLEHIDAIDWNGDPSGPIEAYDWPAYANANGQEAQLAAITAGANGAIVPLTDQTVAGWLREMNAPATLGAAHDVYFDIAMIGGEDQQPGANWVGHWYGRNLRIFRNLTQLADSSDDVVVAIYGHGHAYLLRRFAQESGMFELIEVEDALVE